MASSPFDEGEQVCVDLVLLGGAHAVRAALGLGHLREELHGALGDLLRPIRRASGEDAAVDQSVGLS